MENGNKESEAGIIAVQILGLTNLINEKFKNNDEQHTLLIEQTTKTNGRVTVLEQAKNLAIGGLFVLNIIVIPVIVYFVIKRFGG